MIRDPETLIANTRTLPHFHGYPFLHGGHKGAGVRVIVGEGT